jgi:phosphoinositide-3-kinase regulatory subunit 4
MVLIESWDIETTALVETYETRESFCDTSSTAQIGATPQSIIFGTEAEQNPAAAIAALVRSRTTLSSLDGAPMSVGEGDSSRQTPAWTQPDVWAMVGGADFAGLANFPRPDIGVERVGEGDRSMLKTGGGFILTGSEDRKIRLWDLSNMERSVILTGFEIVNENISFR